MKKHEFVRWFQNRNIKIFRQWFPSKAKREYAEINTMLAKVANHIWKLYKPYLKQITVQDLEYRA